MVHVGVSTVEAKMSDQTKWWFYCINLAHDKLHSVYEFKHSNDRKSKIQE